MDLFYATIPARFVVASFDRPCFQQLGLARVAAILPTTSLGGSSFAKYPPPASPRRNMSAVLQLQGQQSLHRPIRQENTRTNGTGRRYRVSFFLDIITVLLYNSI